MRNRHHARRRRRGKVDRSERVLPPPEAAQHHRPWPMQVLLAAGHPDGIEADEFEAALQIVETFKALVRTVDMTSTTLDRVGAITAPRDSLSNRDAELCAVWFEWSARLPLGLPPRLVGWIEDEVTIGSVEVLRRACRLWDRVRHDRQRGVSALDNPPYPVLPMHVELFCGERVRNIAARPPNLPTEAFSVPAGMLPHPTSSPPLGAQLRQPLQRPVAGPSHARTTAAASPVRLRR